jgi:hypothetical protein
MSWWSLTDTVADKSPAEPPDCLSRFEVCVLYLSVRLMAFDEVSMYPNLINEAA